MRSFAIWYDGKENDHSPLVDIHVNLIESPKDKKWYIDFGIMVYNITNIINPYGIRAGHDVSETRIGLNLGLKFWKR